MQTGKVNPIWNYTKIQKTGRSGDRKKRDE